jgi:ribosome-binding protein aMBF1 (putative translation factor)
MDAAPEHRVFPFQYIFARYAIRYARKGYPVFPLAPLSKKPPKGTRGLSEATTDERQIAEWGREFPDGNIGLRTGPESFDVIDVDPEKGGFDTEEALREEEKLWPDTPVQLTRSGGRHILVQHRELIVTGTDRLGPGIDFRGTGGYIVVAPSVVRDPETGHIGKYEWLCWPKTGIAPAPDWLIDCLKADADKREAEAQERAQNTVDVNPAKASARDCMRYEALAVKILDRCEARLSQKTKPGRNNDLRVRLRRLALGMSQETLAVTMGLASQQIQKYERGTNRIAASRLFWLAKALKVPVGYFFEGCDEAFEAAARKGTP